MRKHIDDNIMNAIQYKKLTDSEEKEICDILVNGNTVIEFLGKKFSSKKRDDYRMAIIKNDYTKLSEEEKQGCQSISEEDKLAVKNIEKVKFRLLQGYVPHLKGLAKKKFRIAKWFAFDSEVMKKELLGETLSAFLHAVWRFNKKNIKFITFLTTVVNNWLINFCQGTAPVKMSKKLKKFISLYYKVVKNNKNLNFDEIIRRMILIELEKRELAENNENVNSLLDEFNPHILALQQTLKIPYEFREDLFPMFQKDSLESLIDDLNNLLSPLQQRIVGYRLNDKTIEEMAEEEGLSCYHAQEAYRKTKHIVADFVAV